VQSNHPAHPLELQTALQLFSSGSDRFSHHFWEFFSFIAFGNLLITKNLYEQLDRMDILPWQAPLVEIGKAKFHSLCGHLYKSHLAYQNVARQLFESSDFPSINIEKEILAFYYYEQALFAKKIGDIDKFNYCLQTGKRLTTISKFILAFDVQLEILRTMTDPTTFDNLEKSIMRLEESGINTLASVGWRTAAIIAKHNRDYPRANLYYQNSLNIAQKFKLRFLINQIYLAMAVMNFEIGNQKSSIELLNSIDPFDTLDPIVCSRNEVQALMAEKEGRYEESMQLVHKALDISLQLDHVVMVPDEAFYLGDKYEKHFKDLDRAEHYYRIGYEHAIRYAEHGIYLTGDRKRVVDAYTNLLQSKSKSVPQTGMSMHPFSFAKGRPWRDIKDIFQHQLLIYHGQTTSNSRALASKLSMPPTTLYSLQTRLKKRGYELPSGDMSQGDDIHEVHEFINGHEHLSWEEINAIFEREMIHYLYEKYGYNKQRMANILELSYPALINKTRELTQVDEHFLPN